VLQAAFGWRDEHLHELGGLVYGGRNWQTRSMIHRRSRRLTSVTSTSTTCPTRGVQTSRRYPAHQLCRRGAQVDFPVPVNSLFAALDEKYEFASHRPGSAIQDRLVEAEVFIH
jgi:hypothetical protein